jgi:hypothetical protein
MRLRATVGVAHGGVVSSDAREHATLHAHTTQAITRKGKRLMWAKEG